MSMSARHNSLLLKHFKHEVIILERIKLHLWGTACPHLIVQAMFTQNGFYSYWDFNISIDLEEIFLYTIKIGKRILAELVNPPKNDHQTEKRN